MQHILSPDSVIAEPQGEPLSFIISESAGLEMDGYFIYKGKKYRVLIVIDKGDHFVVECEEI